MTVSSNKINKVKNSLLTLSLLSFAYTKKGSALILSRKHKKLVFQSSIRMCLFRKLFFQNLKRESGHLKTFDLFGQKI